MTSIDFNQSNNFLLFNEMGDRLVTIASLNDTFSRTKEANAWCNSAGELLTKLPQNTQEHNAIKIARNSLRAKIASNGLTSEAIQHLLSLFKKEVKKPEKAATPSAKASNEMETKEKDAKMKAAEEPLLLKDKMDKMPSEEQVFEEILQIYQPPLDEITEDFRNKILRNVKIMARDAFKACAAAGISDKDWKNIDETAFKKILEASDWNGQFQDPNIPAKLFQLILGNQQKDRQTISLTEVAIAFGWLGSPADISRNDNEIIDAEDLIQLCYMRFFLYQVKEPQHDTPFLGVATYRNAKAIDYSIKINIFRNLILNHTKQKTNVLLLEKNSDQIKCILEVRPHNKRPSSKLEVYMNHYISSELCSCIRNYYSQKMNGKLPCMRFEAPPAPFPKMV